MSLSLFFFVYRTERLSEAFHCSYKNKSIQMHRALYVPHLNTIFLYLYNRTANIVFPLQRTGDIYAKKFNFIRRHETKLNMIYELFYESKAKSLSRYRFNIEHSDRYSGESSVSSKKRSLDEPFSRQLRLKSSDIGEQFSNLNSEEAVNLLFNGAWSMKNCTIKAKSCGFKKDTLYKVIDLLKDNWEYRQIFIELDTDEAKDYMERKLLA